MEPPEEREQVDNEYLRFLRGLRPPDDAANLQAAINDLTSGQTGELDFRTPFPGGDGLADLESDLPHVAPNDGAEFAQMLLAHAEQQRSTEAHAAAEAVVASAARHDGTPNLTDDDVEEAALQLHASSHGHFDAEEYTLSTHAAAATTASGRASRCRYYSTKRVRCNRPAVGADGRCTIHKISQFCKEPQCNKFNQGNGYCIRHGGGKKCKIEGCDKLVQGYGLCSGHGGKPLCPVDGCQRKRMEGGFCKAHGGGRYCQEENCKKRDIGGGFCIAHGGGKKCSAPNCTKVDRGGGYCKRHGGGKRCELDKCRNWAIGGGLCETHKGPGKRCKTPGCMKYDLGGGHCIAHGGGRKCIIDGCTKNRQVNKLCRGHGGKLRCTYDGCDRHAQNNRLCKSHGGGKRCSHEGCTNMQKGGGYCIRHGGGTKCRMDGCTAVDRGGGHCKAHGGGRKCAAVPCKRWVIGGGYCPDHLDLEIERRHEEFSRIASAVEMAQQHSEDVGLRGHGDHDDDLLTRQSSTGSSSGTGSSTEDVATRLAAATAVEMARQHDEMARIASTVSYLSGEAIAL